MFLITLAQGILINQGTCTPPDCANTLAGPKGIEGIVTNVIRAAIPLGGMVLFILLIFAGVNWIAAGSDPKKAEAAKNMATYAILGIVALALSFLIIRLIVFFTGNTQLENFTIYQP